MRYKLVIFDLDFTLYNESDYLVEVIKSTNLFQNTENYSEITYDFRMNSKNIIHDILNLENIMSEKNADVVFEKMKNIKLKINCYPGIKELLDILHSNDQSFVGLLTNGVPDIQKNKLKCLGLNKYFEQKIFAKDHGLQKPSKVLIKKMINKFNVSINSTIMIGDHPVNDIKPAREIGIDTVWIDHQNKNSIKSNYRIIDPLELYKLKEIL